MSLHVSWDQYNELIERLALTVYESGFEFNQIICIARGGLRVGDVLSRIYERPLAILSTHSYAAEGGTVRGDLVIAEHMTMTAPRLGDRVLLVDDMVDSGHTLEKVVTHAAAALPARSRDDDRGALVEGVLGAASPTTTSSTCPTVPGSISRSRSTTRCGRIGCRRGWRASDPSNPDASGVGCATDAGRQARDATRAGPPTTTPAKPRALQVLVPRRGLEPPQCCHR